MYHCNFLQVGHEKTILCTIVTFYKSAARKQSYDCNCKKLQRVKKPVTVAGYNAGSVKVTKSKQTNPTIASYIQRQRCKKLCTYKDKTNTTIVTFYNAGAVKNY
jgi:hypothetical protein